MNNEEDIMVILKFDGVMRSYVPSSFCDMPNIDAMVSRDGVLSSHKHYQLTQMGDDLVLCELTDS